jgi:hypothetical protein
VDYQGWELGETASNLKKFLYINPLQATNLMFAESYPKRRGILMLRRGADTINSCFEHSFEGAIEQRYRGVVCGMSHQ